MSKWHQQYDTDNHRGGVDCDFHADDAGPVCISGQKKRYDSTNLEVAFVVGWAVGVATTIIFALILR